MKSIASLLSKAIRVFIAIVTLNGYVPILRGSINNVNIEDELVFSVDPAFFVWPLITVGFIGSFFVRHWPSTSHFWGWVWASTLLYIFVAVLTNLNITKLVIWSFVFGFFVVLSKHLESLHHIPLLSAVFKHLAALNPNLDPGTVAFVGWLLLVLWIGAIAHAIMNGCKKFTPNQIMELHAVDGSDMLDRAGLHFITRYNDMLESVLGGGSGDIVAMDGQGNVVKEFHNILFLFFLWPRLEEILEQRVTTVDNSSSNAAQVSEVNIKPLLTPAAAK